MTVTPAAVGDKMEEARPAGMGMEVPGWAGPGCRLMVGLSRSSAPQDPPRRTVDGAPSRLAKASCGASLVSILLMNG